MLLNYWCVLGCYCSFVTQLQCFSLSDTVVLVPCVLSACPGLQHFDASQMLSWTSAATTAILHYGFSTVYSTPIQYMKKNSEKKYSWKERDKWREEEQGGPTGVVFCWWWWWWLRRGPHPFDLCKAKASTTLRPARHKEKEGEGNRCSMERRDSPYEEEMRWEWDELLATIASLDAIARTQRKTSFVALRRGRFCLAKVSRSPTPSHRFAMYVAARLPHGYRSNLTCKLFRKRLVL